MTAAVSLRWPCVQRPCVQALARDGQGPRTGSAPSAGQRCPVEGFWDQEVLSRLNVSSSRAHSCHLRATSSARNGLQLVAGQMEQAKLWNWPAAQMNPSNHVRCCGTDDKGELDWKTVSC